MRRPLVQTKSILRRMKLTLFFSLTAFVATAAPPVPKGATPKFSKPEELMKLMEASPRLYEIKEEKNAFTQWAQQNAALAWPQVNPPIPVPRLRPNKDGSFTLENTERPGEIEKMLDKVEPLFEAKDYEGAEKGYAAILAKYPDDYGIHLDWGDAALFSGRPEVALTRYEKATKLNPADHRCWWFRGNALAALGRKKEAIDSWTRALAMAPDNTNLQNGLEVHGPKLGYVFKGRTFLPQARVTPLKEKDNEGYTITVSSRTHWLIWGVCKGVWRGEPSYRKSKTGSEADVFSATEEQECLANLAAMYFGMKKSNKNEADDPMVERLLAVMNEKLLAGFVIYEIASRVQPHVYLLQPPEMQREVEAYLQKFVLVPAPAE